MQPNYGAKPAPYVPVRVTRVLWSNIGILKLLLAAEPLCTTGLLFPSQRNDLVDSDSIVWDWAVFGAGPMLFYWPKLLDSFLSSTVFPCLLSFNWLVLLAGVFGLIGYKSPSLSFAYLI